MSKKSTSFYNFIYAGLLLKSSQADIYPPHLPKYKTPYMVTLLLNLRLFAATNEWGDLQLLGKEICY